MSAVAQILRTTEFALIKEIRKELPLSDLASSSAFKTFMKSLKPHIDDVANECEWQNNNAFLDLLNEVTDEINKQFSSGEEEKITEALVVGTKLAVISGGISLFAVGSVIGGAMVYYYLDKQMRENEANTKSSLAEKWLIETGKDWREARKEKTLTSTSYNLHNLLLVIPANQLPKNLATRQISNEKIHNLISNAVRAYCFAVGDEKGKQVMEDVSCSDAPIDVTTENRVFVQLQLSAQSNIMTQRNKLTIREMLEPNSDGEVLQIKNLELARSASESTGFYKI